MKLYKVINKNAQAKDGGNFDYSPYLPKRNKPGKWTPTIKEIRLCRGGYHVTPYWNMHLSSKDDLIFEVETKGLQEINPENGYENVGVIDKYVCESIRLIAQIKPVYDYKINTGDRNTGDRNTGYRNTGNNNTGNNNTGNRNTGYRNTGNNNTGNWNTGDWNTGDCNTGYWNTGYRNTGDCNTGNGNTGYRNTGYRNTGDNNTGNGNTGYRNTGDWNTGNGNTGYRNTGDWNTGDNNTGCFNTSTPQYYELFNKPIPKKEYENIKFPSYFYFEIEGTYKESWKKAFKNATKEEIQQTIQLPNFNYKIFEEITGISKKMINEVCEE